MVLCLEGVAAYAKNLSKQARGAMRGAETGPGPEGRSSRSLAAICAQGPGGPCDDPRRGGERRVDQLGGRSTWRTPTPASPSGGLDQWLQPYFAARHGEARHAGESATAYIKHAIELVGCFYMRCTDHLPLVPDIGNYLFGGSSSDQAITLGGVTPDGEDAVNDMTYIFLKVTEMLSHPRPQRERPLSCPE
ncbi:MAG: pyruvate formate lyase family protein [Rhodopseudomonas palustris]|nr:pyruvate formate lyase family protein [Rhodopseudomonas palustris]